MLIVISDGYKFLPFFSLPVSQQPQVLVQATVTPIMVSDLLLPLWHCECLLCYDNTNWFTRMYSVHVLVNKLTNDFILY